MSLFHVVDDAFVILRARGVYRQAKIYTREEQLYAGVGSGFIKILGSNGTSAPNVSWVAIVPPPKHTVASGYLGMPSLEKVAVVRRIK